MSKLSLNLLAIDDCDDDDGDGGSNRPYYDDFEDGSSEEHDERHYDALNDETFGLSGDQSEFDWELEHESYSKNELSGSSATAAGNHDNGQNNQKENEAPGSPAPSSPISKTDEIEARRQKEGELIRALMNQMSLRTAAAATATTTTTAQNLVSSAMMRNTTPMPMPPKNIMSVEELERQMLLKQQQSQQTFMPPLRQPQPQQPQMDPRLAANATMMSMLGRNPQMPPGSLQYQNQQQHLQRQQQLYQLSMLRQQQLLMLQQKQPLSAFHQPLPQVMLNAAAAAATAAAAAAAALELTSAVPSFPSPSAMHLPNIASAAAAATSASPYPNYGITGPLPSLLTTAVATPPPTMTPQPKTLLLAHHLRGTDLSFISNPNCPRDHLNAAATAANQFLAKDSDSYCNLFTHGERQWILNVQSAQLRTLTPFIDDFYYCSFMEKRRRECQKYSLRHANNQMNCHKTKKENDEEWRLVKRRMYTTGKFENSLGKLQQASFYAPRKFCEFYSANVNASVDYDYRRAALVNNTAQSENCRYRIVLLEIEEFMRRLLYYEDLLNPLMVMNMKRQKDINEKQHLKEIETSENVEKALFNFQKELNESIKSFEDPDTVLNSILRNILSLERLSSYLNIRKGKSFIIRLLKHLQVQVHEAFLYDFWKYFMQVNLFTMYKKDKLNNDNLVPEFYHLFKKFVYNCDFAKIYAIFSILTSEPQQMQATLNRVRNNTPQPLFFVTRNVREGGGLSSRYTPIPFFVKPQIHFLLTTKFGNSCITSLILRTEYLLLSNKMASEEIRKWNNFLLDLAEIIDEEYLTKTAAAAVGATETADLSVLTKPEEPISRTLMQKIINRNPKLTKSQIKSLFENFTDS